MSIQAQIKITLSKELKKSLMEKASRYGVTVTSYVRYLILKDVQDAEYSEPKSFQKVKL